MLKPELYKADGKSLVWAHWEDSSALFNRATGETHILDALPTEMLLLLSERAADIHTLAQRLAELCDTLCNEEWVNRTSNSLTELYALNLVEKVMADAG